jgi:CubicO group peptidase (beta-lactamase class C family)
LIRRADPQQRRLGQFFHDEIAQPLGLEFYIGLPADVPDSQIANIKPVSLPKLLLNLDKLEYVKRCLNPFQSDSITYRTVMNPRVLTGHGNYNRREMRAVEIPSANGIGQVCSMAKAYSVFATGGAELELGEGTLQALYAPATPPPAGAFDEVLSVESAYSLGFRKPCASGPFGSSDSAFGFAGAGGSLAFADPEAQVGYAYAPNRIGVYLFDDPREKALRDACYRCIEGLQ